jgi:hypothetical protein
MTVYGQADTFCDIDVIAAGSRGYNWLKLAQMIEKMVFRYGPLKEQKLTSDWRISEIESPRNDNWKFENRLGTFAGF